MAQELGKRYDIDLPSEASLDTYSYDRKIEEPRSKLRGMRSLLRFKFLKQHGMWKGDLVVKHRQTIFLLTFFIVVAFFSHGLAFVEWDVQRTLKLENPPIDVTVSINGRWIFILTDQGNILIYSADGTLKDKIAVGNHVDAIKSGAREDMLFLTSRKNKTVQGITLDFIHDIDISGSPFKGPTHAPVAIAVFSDFQ